LFEAVGSAHFFLPPIVIIEFVEVDLEQISEKQKYKRPPIELRDEKLPAATSTCFARFDTSA
jgi:hypothetical protein